MRGAKKYRPYFTESELSLLINTLRKDGSLQCINLMRYLETFALKIERGLIEEQITLKPTIEQKLGFEPEPQVIPEVQKHQLYGMWRNKQPLNPKQLQIALQYAYLNDLLTEEEETEYERTNGLA